MISTNKRTTPFLAILVFFIFIFGCNQDPSTLSFENQTEVQLAKVKTFTDLTPPAGSPSPNGHGRAEVEFEAGKRLRLKVDVDDVEVIGVAADPEFCNGFYEVALTGATLPPVFPGLVVTCDIAGNHQGPTRGFLNFDIRLDKGDPFINLIGTTLEIWEVEPVRDIVTRKAVQGPNGQPFIIESRVAVALSGVLN